MLSPESIACVAPIAHLGITVCQLMIPIKGQYSTTRTQTQRLRYETAIGLDARAAGQLNIRLGRGFSPAAHGVAATRYKTWGLCTQVIPEGIGFHGSGRQQAGWETSYHLAEIVGAPHREGLGDMGEQQWYQLVS